MPHTLISVHLGSRYGACNHVYVELSLLSKHLHTEIDDLLKELCQAQKYVFQLEKKSKGKHSDAILETTMLLSEDDSCLGPDKQVRLSTRWLIGDKS